VKKMTTALVQRMKDAATEIAIEVTQTGKSK
jgi:hypothetical protein